MPEYRRAFVPGGTYFFTVVTHCRRPILCDARMTTHIRAAFEEEQRRAPFESLGGVLLPDHMHCVWELPPGDTAYSARWSRIKRRIGDAWIAAGGGIGRASASRHAKRERGLWQRRFWEHTIRNEADLIRHLDYMHYNPVKHGAASCPHAWPHSSFHRYVRAGRYAADWNCTCAGRRPPTMDWSGLQDTAME